MSLPTQRLHDLDALRAFAMLLGIVLHALLSFTGQWWIVRDTSSSPLFQWIVEAIHGFRMPLFFLLSGFFTAMLWNRRGPADLLRQRTLRIVLPLMIGMVTIIPLMWTSVGLAFRLSPEPPELGELWSAAAEGDTQTVVGLVATGADIDALDPEHGLAPLAYASLFQRTETMTALLGLGADVNVRTSDGDTCLHTAAFFGLDRSARVLIDAGADTTLLNRSGSTPMLTMLAPKEITVAFGAELGYDDWDAIVAGRERIAAMLTDLAPQPPPDANAQPTRAPWRDTLERLMARDVFAHLWFLWFLCWLLAAFASAMPIVRLFPRPPRALLASGLCLLWLLPLTWVFQRLMHSGGFGPDTSTGLIPMPHVLGYYAVFFGFGALLFTSDGAIRALTRRWWVYALLGAGAFLLSHELREGSSIAAMLGGDSVVALIEDAAQVTYTWCTSLALIGIFGVVFSRERYWVRFASDSSYWLYLVHLPLVIVGQALARLMTLPALVEASVLIASVTLVLLVSYRYAVRYTPVGTLLNGKRTRRAGPSI
ncbi:MAG: acyltransferase family protein [Phycisphaerales bacterium]